MSRGPVRLIGAIVLAWLVLVVMGWAVGYARSPEIVIAILGIALLALVPPALVAQLLFDRRSHADGTWSVSALCVLVWDGILFAVAAAEGMVNDIDDDPIRLAVGLALYIAALTLIVHSVTKPRSGAAGPDGL